MDVPKGDVKCGGGKAGTDTDEKGWEMKEVGLKEVSGGNIEGVMCVDFQWHDSQES